MLRFFTWAVMASLLLMPASAHAAVIDFMFPINLEQEVQDPPPTITDPVFPGFEPVGVGMMTFDTETSLLEWTIYYVGLTGPLTAAHIHHAPVGQNGGVEVTLSTGGPSAGEIIGSATLSSELATLLLAGDLYVNLHTEANPAGEIRGQIIPEPASFALLGAGVVLAASRRRSRTLAA